MKNNLLVERFQKLAGIKPLYGGETVKKIKEDIGSAVKRVDKNFDREAEKNKDTSDFASNEDGGTLKDQFLKYGTPEEIDQYLGSLKKDMELNGGGGYEGWKKSDFVEDFKKYLDESNGALYESNGALSSQVEAWLVEEIKGHNASEQSINGEFELGITKRYYGHDPMALKLMDEMEQLGEITINIKASDVYHDDIEDIKVLSVESDYVVVKWGTYVSDDEDEWIEA